MTSIKTQKLWRPDAAIALVAAVAGMVGLWIAGLPDVAWTPAFFAAIEMGRRRRRAGCLTPRSHAQ